MINMESFSTMINMESFATVTNMGSFATMINMESFATMISMESFSTMINKAVKYCCKALHLRCSRGTGHASTISMVRSSRLEVFCKKGVLRNFAKFTGKHLCQSPFIKKEALVQVFSCEFCEILRTRFFKKHLWWLLLHGVLTSCCTYFMLHFFHFALF